MLSIADAHSFRVLILATQKCITKLAALACATFSADEAKACMRVIKGKHCHGQKDAMVYTELGVLPISRCARPLSSIIPYAHPISEFEFFFS